MKWISRTLIILLLISTLMILGALFGGMNFSVIENFFKDDEAYGDIKTFEATQMITELEIDASDRHINIEYIETGSLTLNYYEHKQDRWIFNEEDGKLTVTQKRVFSLINNFTFKYTSKEVKMITIFVPVNTLLVVDVDTDVGDITFDLGESELTSVQLSTDTGNINIKNASITQGLYIQSNTGNVKITFVETPSIGVDCDTGKVQIEDTQSDWMIIRNSTGDIVIKRTEAADLLKLTTQTGKIDVQNSISDNYELKTSTGNIYFQNTDLFETIITYDLKVTVGSIYINSQNQGSRHQTTGGDVSIKAESSTGSIRIITQ